MVFATCALRNKVVLFIVDSYSCVLQDLSVLVKALLAHGQVTELDLSYNSISDNGLGTLSLYLKGYT